MNSKYFPSKENLDISVSFLGIGGFPLPTDQAPRGTPAARLLGNTERPEKALRSRRKWPPSGSGTTSGRGRHLAVRQQELVWRDALDRGCVLGPRQGPGDGASPRRGPCAAALFALRFQRRVRPERRRLRTPPPTPLPQPLGVAAAPQASSPCVARSALASRLPFSGRPRGSWGRPGCPARLSSAAGDR